MLGQFIRTPSDSGINVEGFRSRHQDDITQNFNTNRKVPRTCYNQTSKKLDNYVFILSFLAKRNRCEY